MRMRIAQILAAVCAAVCLLTLSGCGGRPRLEGVVTDATDRALLVENGTGRYWVSWDGAADFSVGDEVIVSYDGRIAESEPAQIFTVYAVTRKAPDAGSVPS